VAVGPVGQAEGPAEHGLVGVREVAPAVLEEHPEAALVRRVDAELLELLVDEGRGLDHGMPVPLSRTIRKRCAILPVLLTWGIPSEGAGRAEREKRGGGVPPS